MILIPFFFKKTSVLEGYMAMESSLNDILNEAKNLLKDELSELSYKTWLLPLEIYGIDNNNVILISDDPFKKESVESRFKDLLENAFSIILQKKCTISIVLKSENDTQDKNSNFSNVNYSKTGTYYAKATAFNNSGLQASKTFRVIIKKKAMPLSTILLIVFISILSLLLVGATVFLSILK